MQRAITRFLDTTGNTAPIKSVDLVARVQGFLQSIDYQDGAAVKKGTQLFGIEREVYQAQLDQAKAQLAKDQAVLAEAQVNLTRYQKLQQQNSIAAQQAEREAKTCEGRTQFVGDVAKQKFLCTYQALHLLGHVVEVMYQALDFVTAKETLFSIGLGHARAQLPIGETTGGCTEFADRSHQQQYDHERGNAENNNGYRKLRKRKVKNVVPAAGPAGPMR